MSSGGELMISGMGGSVPLIAMRGGAAESDVSGNTATAYTAAVAAETPAVAAETPAVNAANAAVNADTAAVNAANTAVAVPDISNGVTWDGVQYSITDMNLWKEDDATNFLNFLGIPKTVFISDKEYTDFIAGIKVCLKDTSSIDSTCESVNNILRRVIEMRIQDLVEQQRFGNVQKVMTVI